MLQQQWMASVHHDGSPRYVTPPPHALGHTVQLRLRADLDAPITAAYIRTSPDGEQELTPMRRVADAGICQWWEGEVRLHMPRSHYRFVLATPAGNWTLNAADITRHTPTDALDFTLLPEATTPTWVADAIFYQIFPDRFWDGDPTSNVQNGEYQCYGRPVVARGWDDMPQKPGTGEAGGVEFFGGDLAGIIQRLDYLQDLGVNALYLTPIFTSPSNHKYDVQDYTHVDPHFGGDAALADLRAALDARGMRLLLDIIPNHTSATHPWFLAARADPHAPTAEFYTFGDGPDDYTAWLGVKSLPKLNYRSEQLRQIMYAGPDAIMRRWLRPPFR
ncbi:MAG: maltodextrin glucosidase, partial [Ktedonobacterales bacterium]|nr:maltodextrin glucosidase [Ktedonobacterales bacterium]